MILSFLFFTFVAYLLFKLVFDFVIPIYKTTMRVKQKVRNMQDGINGQGTRGSNNATTKTASPKEPTKPVGDYIDFEEVKE